MGEREKRQARSRMVEGHEPECGDWYLIPSIRDEDGIRWCIYYRDNGGLWYTVKVFADGRAQRKANFWLGWNGERTNRSRDVFILEQQRPMLYEGVIDKLKENLPYIDC